MWLLLKGLALRFIVGRTVGGAFSLLLLLLVPLGGVLKFIGLPLLLILGVLGAPIFLLLAAIGLPALFVVGVGGVLLLMLGIFLSLGILAIKIVLPIVLIVWFVKWVRRRWASEPGLDAGAAPGTP